MIFPLIRIKEGLWVFIICLVSPDSLHLVGKDGSGSTTDEDKLSTSNPYLFSLDETAPL